MMELRDVIARTVFEFDVCLPEGVAEGFEMANFMRGMKDCFMATVPDVEVVFTSRVR